MQVDRYLEIAKPHTPSYIKKKSYPCEEDMEPVSLYEKKDEQVCRLHQHRVTEATKLNGDVASMVFSVPRSTGEVLLLTITIPEASQ